VLPDQVRVEAYVVVHLVFVLPYSWLYRQEELWRATVGGGSAKTPIRGAHIAGERMGINAHKRGTIEIAEIPGK
jgi:hypothetical protein